MSQELSPQAQPGLVAGRYALFDRIASGGMASVHFARVFATGGFSRVVAAKRLHPQFAQDPDFVELFLDEARMASRIRHPNVVPVLDVVSTGDELVLVMEYVHGEKLSALLAESANRSLLVPIPIAIAITIGVLRGLQAAHEATNAAGEPLEMVHRDVSPQNVLVTTAGVPQLLDFGIAKAVGRSRTTQEGQIRGKLAYMPIEQLSVGGKVNAQTDVYAATVVLWEMLTGARLFSGQTEGQIYASVMEHRIEPPSRLVHGIPLELDRLVMSGLEKKQTNRPSSAAEMAQALEALVTPAPQSAIALWVEELAGTTLERRRGKLATIEKQAAPPALSQAAQASGTHLETTSAPVNTASSRKERELRRPAWAGVVGGLLLFGIALLSWRWAVLAETSSVELHRALSSDQVRREVIRPTAPVVQKPSALKTDEPKSRTRPTPKPISRQRALPKESGDQNRPQKLSRTGGGRDLEDSARVPIDVLAAKSLGYTSQDRASLPLRR